ncbi:MAG: hypothetical protein M3530_01820 [Thermoproteota archaeon]|nr:hypothetical protein [Thermoproteota archaeon]
MSDRLTGFSTSLALMLISALVYFQIGPLNKLESSQLAMAAETGKETAE